MGWSVALGCHGLVCCNGRFWVGQLCWVVMVWLVVLGCQGLISFAGLSWAGQLCWAVMG